MPNHVTNIVVADKEVIDAIMTDENSVDFNNITPMPESVFRGDIAREDKIRTKSWNWRDWSIQNWGTKWNAYDCERIDDNTVKFDTAWSMPDAMYKTWSLMGKIVVKYADEDLSYNCGKVVYENGDSMYLTHFAEGSNEAMQFAVGVKYGGELPDWLWNNNGIIQYR